MITRFKHMLGIEGAKVKVILDESSSPSEGRVMGEIELVSMNVVSIENIYIKVEERYERGRGKRKLIDKYLLVENEIPVHIDLVPGSPVLIPFELSFNKLASPADQFASRNVINELLTWTAKRLKKVRSSYMLTAEAIVEGTKLNPFDSVEILSE